jgi:hypothetical protein
MSKRIAIFTSNNYTWAFPSWTRTIPELIKRYDVIGIYLFPEKLGKMKGAQISLWFLRIFGACNFVLLALYSIKTRFLQLTSQVRTWKHLCIKYNIELNTGQTPNSKIVCDWVKKNNIDIIFITEPTILKEDIIASPNIGIINKHAAVLPSCQGLFPFLWAKINGSPTGITFHKVNAGIDTGEILVQIRYPSGDSRGISMLRFYLDVFYLFSSMASLAVERLIEKDYRKPSLVGASSYSFPTKEDYKEYHGKSCKIAQLSDLFYQPNLPLEEIIA